MGKLHYLKVFITWINLNSVEFSIHQKQLFQIARYVVQKYQWFKNGVLMYVGRALGKFCNLRKNPPKKICGKNMDQFKNMYVLTTTINIHSHI